MILKVQVSLSTNLSAPQVLLYDETRIVMIQVDLDAVVRKRMQGRPKAFFEADVLDLGDGEVDIVLHDEVKDPGW